MPALQRGLRGATGIAQGPGTAGKSPAGAGAESRDRLRQGLLRLGARERRGTNHGADDPAQWRAGSGVLAGGAGVRGTRPEAGGGRRRVRERGGNRLGRGDRGRQLRAAAAVPWRTGQQQRLYGAQRLREGGADGHARAGRGRGGSRAGRDSERGGGSGGGGGHQRDAQRAGCAPEASGAGRPDAAAGGDTGGLGTGSVRGSEDAGATGWRGGAAGGAGRRGRAPAGERGGRGDGDGDALDHGRSRQRGDCLGHRHLDLRPRDRSGRGGGELGAAPGRRDHGAAAGSGEPGWGAGGGDGAGSAAGTGANRGRRGAPESRAGLEGRGGPRAGRRLRRTYRRWRITGRVRAER